MGDDAIEVIAETCPALTSINLGRCEALMDQGIEAIAVNCPPMLRTLDLPTDPPTTGRGRYHDVDDGVKNQTK